MFPFFYCFLPNSINRKDKEIKKVDEENSEEMLGSEYGYETVHYTDILFFKEFIFPMMGAFLAYFVI